MKFIHESCNGRFQETVCINKQGLPNPLLCSVSDFNQIHNCHWWDIHVSPHLSMTSSVLAALGTAWSVDWRWIMSMLSVFCPCGQRAPPVSSTCQTMSLYAEHCCAFVYACSIVCVQRWEGVAVSQWLHLNESCDCTTNSIKAVTSLSGAQLTHHRYTRYEVQKHYSYTYCPSKDVLDDVHVFLRRHKFMNITPLHMGILEYQ